MPIGIAVYAELRRLNDQGFNIWYDEGITPSARWSEELARAIENSSAFLAFISPDFVASDTCLNELDFALNRKLPLLAVHLEETTLPSGVELSLGGKQAILRYAIEPEVYGTRVENTLAGLLGGDVPSRLPAASRARRRRVWAPVVALTLLLAALVYFVDQQQTAPVATEQPAIGVVPFEILNAGEDEQYLGDAIAEDLSMRLGSWRLMPVIAHASMLRSEATSEPRARYLVRGSVRLTADQLSVTALLVDSESETEIWHERFVESRDDLFAVQERLSTAILARLRPALVEAESSRAARKDPNNVSAWEAALRGWWHVNRDTREDMALARDWFAQASERDPTWSWPHASVRAHPLPGSGQWLEQIRPGCGRGNELVGATRHRAGCIGCVLAPRAGAWLISAPEERTRRWQRLHVVWSLHRSMPWRTVATVCSWLLPIGPNWRSKRLSRPCS